MASSLRLTFNHVGLCVSDCERSRRFYENVLGFQFWWELDPPDGPTSKLVQLSEPLGVHATLLGARRVRARTGARGLLEAPG